MKNDSSYGLIGILMVLLIFISGGYWYSCSLRTQVTEIWKQTLWGRSYEQDERSQSKEDTCIYSDSFPRN